MKYLNLYIAIICGIILSACVGDPDSPAGESHDSADAVGAYIICEGLWHYDNSSLSKYLIDSNMVIADYFALANGGLKLGDLANGGTVYGKYLYIVVSTPAIIEKIDLATGKIAASIQLENGCTPRKIYIVNDSLAYVSCLMTHDVKVINPAAATVYPISISVGPAPEGITGYGNYIFTVNSGYGDYLADRPKAGTISVIDIRSNSETQTLECGANPVVIQANAKFGRLYAIYYNLPSLEDSLGGIVEYDLHTLKETRRLRVYATSMTFTSGGDSLLFIDTNGVNYIDLRERSFSPRLMIANSKPTEHWYSLAVSSRGELFVGNAKNYQMQGELLVYQLTVGGSLLRKYSVGVNPNSILFYSLEK